MSLIFKPNASRGALLPVAAGTALVLVTYVTPMATLAPTSEDLGAGTVSGAWILSAMSIGLAGALLAGGLLGDRVGRRRVYVGGLLAVVAGAFACAVAWDPWILVGARVLQGAGGAAVLACGLAILAHSYPSGRERVHATAVWGACVGGGVAGGSLLAMALDVGTGWRENYVAVAVVGTLLLVPTLRGVPETRAGVARRIDVGGLALLIAGMVLLVSALTQVRDGVGVVAAVLIVLALMIFVALWAVERRAEHPLVDPDLLRHPSFLATTFGALTLGVGMIGMASFLPTVAQAGFGDSLRMASVPPLVWAVTSMSASLALRWLPLPLRGPLPIAALLALTAAGMITAIGADSTVQLLVPMSLTGITTGLLNAILGREAVAGAPPDHAAMASGANNTARYLGAACGITLFAVIAANTGGDITGGWTNAVLTAACITLLGAVSIAALAVLRTRRHVHI
ncbi:MFS transporter [Rhodococcus artemisiae]|uniref:MFS transporter n=1 Tax=Rhodococcus artemisiae TaxID=714159 RepID=A0ABU7L6X6_9NOCA|nr:MFS transporter [Rhodococcus artemisiae]MEE2057074.1 MFS transporter [Rhodococcus artemisiae]